MTKSENINELAAALAKAQSEICGAIKDSANPFFKSSYADLGSVWAAVRDPLTKNGICVTQTTEHTAAGLMLTTTLAHTSGQWMSSTSFPINPVKPDPQSLGSATSYARRYQLSAMLCLPQIDDDGEGAMGRWKKPSEKGKLAAVPTEVETGPGVDPVANYEIKVGNHAGKKLSSIADLAKYVGGVKNYHEQQGMKMSPQWAEFVARAEEYLTREPSFAEFAGTTV